MVSSTELVVNLSLINIFCYLDQHSRAHSPLCNEPGRNVAQMASHTRVSVSYNVNPAVTRPRSLSASPMDLVHEVQYNFVWILQIFLNYVNDLMNKEFL